MTDGNTTGEAGVRGTGRGRLTLVLGGALAVALLATVGATAGWILAGENDGPAASVASATATGSPTGAASASPTPDRSTPAAPRTTAPTRSPGLTVPAVIGEDFEHARDELRERRLGWRLVFGSGVGTTVERTDPRVGTEVERGRTVTLYVSGPAPQTRVPDVVGEECPAAADELVEEGFYPRYPLRRTGTVLRQDPAGDSEGRWNDPVSIWCGDASPEPGSAPPTP